jgi:hypothetical protein
MTALYRTEFGLHLRGLNKPAFKYPQPPRNGSFIALPNLPSRDIPALCFKKSRGLLTRVAESDESKRLIFDSTQLFSSAEGQGITACSCSIKSVDAVTVSKELVENLERFVGAMDGISNGGFLRGDEELGLDWVELEWLLVLFFYLFFLLASVYSFSFHSDLLLS